MKTVDVGYQDGWRQDKQEEVADEEVGAPEGQLDDLHDEFARRLRHGMRAQATAVPLARPPCPIRLVVLELTREEHRDEDLVKRALDEDNRDETKHRMRDVPELQEPLQDPTSQ